MCLLAVTILAFVPVQPHHDEPKARKRSANKQKALGKGGNRQVDRAALSASSPHTKQ